MEAEQDFRERITSDGFAIVHGVLASERIDRLRTVIAALPDGEAVRRKVSVYGVRNLFEVSEEVRELAADAQLRSFVAPVLGPDCFAVRATFFDKVPDANWNLRWHQDGVISVKQRLDTPGFAAWSNKAGTLQVRPPDHVLLNMLALRVHLDDCPASNGALRVLAGSHTQRWPREEISECKSRFREVICEVGVGGVLAMRPLILHASSASNAPGHRRVIHIEFACHELPGELQWKHRIAKKLPIL